MDRTGEHYAKWNKPGGKGQIPYDLTFNWNLINKTNKQAKYNQRYWIKNNLTVTRGEVGGDNGGKSCQELLKGHMDKTKDGRKQGREVGMAGVEGECGW